MKRKPAFRVRVVGGIGRPIDLLDKPITIGRHPDNVLRVLDQKSSRNHAVIGLLGSGSPAVQDLGSRNGTFVNGDQVQKARLNAGDVVTIGDTELLIEQVEGAKASSEDPGGTVGPGASRGPVGPWEQELIALLAGLPPKTAAEPEVSLIDARGRPSAALSGDGAGPRAFRLLLQLSSKARATDIHIEPKRDAVQVRMRVDGQMIWTCELPAEVGQAVEGVVKIICHMKTTHSDAVLDGHFSARFPDRRVEFRASFTPSVHGQKLVLRILDSRDVPTSLAEVGLMPYMIDPIRRVCRQDAGMFLVCGPTGSGKTTTLYNGLREVDRDHKNVVTIEDPVEYQLDGVTQMPIDEHRGNTFSSLLRSVLRQDPDVILVGEIRDDETARTAMQAAMTGHVVFSTVHAKDSISAVFRLLDLGVEPYLVANALDLVLAQRLVRVLCDNCKREVPVPPGVASRIGKHLGGKTSMCVPVGCKRCLGVGFRGRRALFELLVFDDELRDVVLTEPSIQAMKKVIQGGLFTTLAQFGWRLAAEGITSIEEVERATGHV
ncbi:MAG: ATPase, T2SS/T4P/T4SS family [Planctomycetota bacterium]